ncbi:hypothetical protein C3489_29520 [Streptomyces sp. Ru71]|uniref:hypothetical protein n=1 Tax=Streptomyces sp. Ru71 TaxID=2080746 RepID=UPI000CDD6457|nr:hypothetical protein [Streptomyces sp. Ru71]POX47465.1 hypothetical protein C3489_29520 [Streptomyces sp. Ru71]
MRRRTLAALCTLGALGGLLAMPTAAQAADPYPNGPSVRTDDTRVYVDFGTSTPPEDLKVVLRKEGTDAPVATVTEFGADSGGTAVKTSALRLADLGRYAVDVEYAGTGGETVLHKDEAVLDYHLIPLVKTFDVIGTPDLEHRTVTLKADATLRDPRDDSEKPMVNGRLVVETTAARTGVTTDAAGHLEVPFTFTGTEKQDKRTWQNDVRVAVRPAGADPSHGQARYVVVPIAETTITLDSPKVTGPDGTDAPLTGRATYRYRDGVSRPVPLGTAMEVYKAYNSTWYRERNFTAGEDGRFTVQVPIYGTQPKLAALPETPWLWGTRTTFSSDPTTSAGFHRNLAITVSPYKKVTVSGIFDRYDLPAATTLTVNVQFKAKGTTDWVTKQTLDSPATAGNSSRTVTAENMPYPGPGDWRFQFAGTKDIPAGTASPAAYGARTMTAFPEFNANPEPVKAGAPITVTGKLSEKYEGVNPAVWYALPGERIGIYFREYGTTTWRGVGATTTGQDGSFTMTFTAAKDGDWQARYAGDDLYRFYSYSRLDFVDVQ